MQHLVLSEAEASWSSGHCSPKAMDARPDGSPPAKDKGIKNSNFLSLDLFKIMFSATWSQPDIIPPRAVYKASQTQCVHSGSISRLTLVPLPKVSSAGGAPSSLPPHRKQGSFSSRPVRAFPQLIRHRTSWPPLPGAYLTSTLWFLRLHDWIGCVLQPNLRSPTARLRPSAPAGHPPACLRLREQAPTSKAAPFGLDSRCLGQSTRTRRECTPLPGPAAEMKTSPAQDYRTQGQ